MTCASCEHENRPGAKFCEECAAPLKRLCASCGSELRPSAKFCDECAAQVAESPPVRPAEAAGARKVVTIVFADLVGSTALHERLDAESARLFMERYYVAMRGAVEAHGGTVTQLLGDGVKAVFGIPRVSEDDAIRAVRAAVGMQAAFRELAEQQRLAVGKTGLRVAVNTGEVVANDASEIIGDPVNVAARLQEQARDGDVVIGESTQALVAALVTLAPLGSFALKGRTEAVSAYRVESLERPASAAAAAFVGRDAELARISAVYEAAVAAPGARLVVTLGSPGQGKSRLIDEFARRLGETATIVRAQCDAAGGASFAPLADALRALPDIASSLPASDAERARIVAGINALLAGSPASPEETFFVVRRLLAALAAARPVVLVIDDLHWAEPLLLDLIEHLVQWVRDSALLVLVGARPELRDTRSSLATPGGAVAELITLAGLDAGAATRLAANVIGAADLPAAVAAKVLATSEGNPLFVGELVRMLVHEGALKKEGERWITGTALAELEMPPTIQALLASRIERLRPEDRTVLERAAVVGRSFSRSAVAELLPRDVSDLDARLESLRRSELVEPDTGWFLGEPALRFHHLLIRDAAYRRLLKGTRAELHARLADWIEARVGEAIEHDETIGWHLEQAHVHLGELGPIDARGKAIGERAARLLAAAGRRALARDDLPLAASLLGRALARLDEADPARADLALDWCEALLSAGDVGPAAAAIDELGRFAGDSDRLRAWHTCFKGQLTALTAPQALRATVEAVTGAAATLASLGDAAGEAKAHFVHAQAYARLGKVGACEAALDRALAAARRAGDRRRANAVLAGAPLAALWGPSPVTRASGRCLDVVRVLRISQEAPAVEAIALSCQGLLEALRGRAEAARRMIASSRKMVEELGITHRLFETDVFAGRIDLLEGEPVAAERGLRGAYEGLRDLGLGSDAAQAAALLARALLAQGRDAEAESLSHESETLAGDDLRAAIAWRGVRAEALARRGEHAAAIDLAEAAVAIAAATDALLDHADARLSLAAALRASGRTSDADAEERRAIELWQAKGATLLAERARDTESRTVSVDRSLAARAESTHPIRRQVRANAATASAARYDAAISARDEAALHDILAEGAQSVHHPTGAVYDRATAIANARAVFRGENLRFETVPLATLGDSLALCLISWSASGISTKRFDVGAYESESIVLIEVDAQGRRVRLEQFAIDRLGDAVARLYERYAELLPDGPERTRAATTARSVAALFGAPDRWPLAPDVEAVDHRTVGFGSLHGVEAALHATRTLVELSDDFTCRVDDVLDLQGEALFLRWTTSGTIRASGGSFERSLCQLFFFAADGCVTRWEQFDAEQDAEARARFDELVAGAKSAPRRVRANAAIANQARFEAAIASRDEAALRDQYAEGAEMVHHSTGALYDRATAIVRAHAMFRAENFHLETLPLATLGDSLALVRMSWSASGLSARSFDVGAYENEGIMLIEVDAQGRRVRSEQFEADRLADALPRLYARHAELLPHGPARDRAAAIARSLAGNLGPPDLDASIAAFSAAVEFVDHRVLGFEPLRGRDAVRQLFRSRLETSGNFEFRVDDVLSLTPDALLVCWTTSGTARVGGGEYVTQVLMLWVFGGDGLIERLEYFDADRETEALVRADALTVEAARPSPVWRRVRPNAVTAVWARFGAAFAARDDAALADCFSASSETIHHPTGTTYGRDGSLDSLRRLQRSRDAEYRHEALATLGASLGISRQWTSASGTSGSRFDVGAYERQEIAINQVDEAGRFHRSEFFSVDQLSDAVSRLYERYAEQQPEGAARDRAAAIARSVAAMLAMPDLARRAAAFALEIEFVDHRIVGVGSVRGADAVLRAIGALHDLVETAGTRLDDVIDLRADAIVLRWTHFGTTRDGGGSFERSLAHLWIFGADGLLTRWEQAEGERSDELLAPLDELATAAPTAPRFANAATRVWDEELATFMARDWRRHRENMSERFRFQDRNRIAQLELDRDQRLEYVRAFGEMSSVRVASRILGTRGERLALAYLRAELAGGDVGPSEIESLVVIEANHRGKADRYVRFDPDALDAAYAELDARYEAGEAAEHRLAWSAMKAGHRALSNHDWEAFAERFRADFVGHDHRLLGWGTLHGPPAWVEMQRVMVDLAPDVTRRRDHVRLSTRGLLSQSSQSGTHDGGAFERSWVNVSELDEHGKNRRTDLYDLDQLDQALARFDAITAESPAPRFENAATQTHARVDELWRVRDWERFAALFQAEFRNIDRRRMVLLELDRDQYLESIRRVFAMSANTTEVLATRGSRLALARVRWEGSDGDVGPSEGEFVLVAEVDDRGSIGALIQFDPDALDAAYAELDARYDAGESAAHGHAVAWRRTMTRALSTHEWDEAIGTGDANLVAQDHRPVGWGTLHGPAAWVGTLQSLVELAPDVQARFDHVRTCQAGMVFEAAWRGTRDGGAFEIPIVGVIELGAQGKMRRFDLYEPGQLDQALARFDELKAAPPAQARFANAATRAWQERNAAWVAGDWERFAQLTPIGFRCLDRRRMFLLDLDREQYLEFARSLGDGRSRGLDSQILATRGDRLALTRDRTLVSDGEIGPSESERLNVVETNERGEALAIVRLDPDDLDAAYAELDARNDVGEAAKNHGGWSETRAFHRAVESRDWEAVAALCAPDLVRRDHRLLGFAETRGPAAFVDVHRALIDLAPDARLRYDHVRTCDRGALFEVVWHGSRDGGAFEIPLIGVSELDERGAVYRYDIYDLDQLEQAEARFAELAPDPRRIPPNTASRLGDRLHAARMARDMAAHRALAARDFTWEDRGRRALLSGDVETWISSTQFNWAQPGFRSESELIGTVGDRLQLEHTTWTGGSEGTGFENVRVRVRMLEVDATGLCRAVVLYDDEDRREAFAEAQRRFLIGEAAGIGGQASIAALVSAIGRRDWDALRGSLAPDAAICDRRALAIMGEIDREQWIDSLRTLADLAPDMDWELSRILAWNQNGRVSAGRLFGTPRDAGPFENAFVAVLLTGGDHVQRYEFFDVDDAERALARFAELCASGPETAS